MANFVRIRVGDIIFDKKQRIDGKVTYINFKDKVAKVETITNFDKATGERTSKLVECRLFNLVVLESIAEKNNYDINKWWSWVREFQLAFGHPAPDKPTMLSKERIEKRNSWMLEECNELLEAETLEDQVDAAIDKLYFALGDLVELGVKPHNLLRIVQNANMGKLHNINGELVPVYKADGKVQKPDDWEEKFAPEKKLKIEIERQLRD